MELFIHEIIVVLVLRNTHGQALELALVYFYPSRAAKKNKTHEARSFAYKATMNVAFS